MVDVLYLGCQEHAGNPDEVQILILIMGDGLLEEQVHESYGAKERLVHRRVLVVAEDFDHPVHHLGSEALLDALLSQGLPKENRLLLQVLVVVPVVVPVVGEVPAELRIVWVI